MFCVRFITVSCRLTYSCSSKSKMLYVKNVCKHLMYITINIKKLVPNFELSCEREDPGSNLQRTYTKSKVVTNNNDVNLTISCRTYRPTYFIKMKEIFTTLFSWIWKLTWAKLIGINEGNIELFEYYIFPSHNKEEVNSIFVKYFTVFLVILHWICMRNYSG